MKTLCKIRDIQKALEEYEIIFLKDVGLSLKESMVLCSLSDDAECSSTEIALKIDLTCSNCSKILGAVERKGYIVRNHGSDDKRNVFFSLTPAGRDKLREIEVQMPLVPAILC